MCKIKVNEIIEKLHAHADDILMSGDFKAYTGVTRDIVYLESTEGVCDFEVELIHEKYKDII